MTPLLRRRLPLVPLATLAGLYGRLRARVPGLADLGLADLEQMLLAALSPAERAAVARLVASDDALLATSFNPAPEGPAGDDESVITRPAAITRQAQRPHCLASRTSRWSWPQPSPREQRSNYSMLTRKGQ